MSDQVQSELDQECEEERPARREYADAFTLPRRFPWAPDEEVEALENEMAAMLERYR